MKAAKWIMRGITTVVICVMLGVIIMSAVLGKQARQTMKEERKAKAKSSYVEKIQAVTDGFKNVYIQAAADMDITIRRAESGQCQVSYFDSDEVTHRVYVQDDTLTINCRDERIFGSDIGFGDDPYVTVSLPEGEYGNVTVISESGDISSNVSIVCDRLDITEDDGNVFLSSIDGKRADVNTVSGDVTIATMDMDHISIKGENGDFFLMNLSAENMDISSGNGLLEGYNLTAWNIQNFVTDKGDIDIEGCEGGTMWLSSRKGNIEVSLLSPKRIMVDSDDGDINVPESSVFVMESCIAHTDSGNIMITYMNEQEE